ncbi:Crp/Fnr family transcriptional regulator [Streptomyces sp. DSM 44915]|uniref:Crp/Fnr family transcriptional regulator n=1 Tax=Streptomyces chisholmiae TaxID=3075540 RepID=A0ABU2JYV0_9ACTN|nr:Crp/Fnr family transcriptional regulator [Streptomyces sp. DSM 44915]MDT0270175.1 Crp/Fnr family transcriptional regulator [Streptomyces sp. DSM 44915]
MGEVEPFTAEQLGLIHGAGRERRWARGAAVVSEGMPSGEVILLESGLVKITTELANGYTSLLAVRGPGELLGELSCLDGRPRSATGTALEPVRGTVVPGERFRRLLAAHGSLALAVLCSVAARLRDSDRLRAEHGAYPAGVRVAHVLWEMASRHGVPTADPPGGLVVRVTQQELAGAAGTSRESLVRALAELASEGLIERGRGRTLVRDPEGLRDRGLE